MAMTDTATSTAVAQVMASRQPGEPGWWLARLMDRLAVQADRANHLERYYQGAQGIPVRNQAVSSAYRRMMALASTNFAHLIVEAVRERMDPGGFLTGAVNDPSGDAEAWELWQANSLDADCELVHRAMLSMAAAYVIVGQVGEEGNERVVITPEDPRQVIAECDPVQRRLVRAALKVWRDSPAGVDRANLFLPGQLWEATRPAESVPGEFDGPLILDITGGWEWIPEPRKLPGQRVPVVPFLNRVDLFGRPMAEFEPVIPILDRINYMILNRLEVATLQAFRQRAIKGLAVHDESGNEIDYSDVFAADPGALWQLPETAEIWESGQVDLGPIRSAIRDDVEHLAAVSRMPVHYLEPVNESAEGVEAKREGLIFTAEDRCKAAGESWEQVMSLAFEFAGDAERAERADMEIVWNSVERQTLTERSSAAVQAQAAGVPWRTTMTDIMGFSVQQVDRMMAERTGDQLRALMGMGAATTVTTTAANEAGGTGG